MNEVLDQKLLEFEDLKKGLAGKFERFYEVNNGKIIVEKTEVVQVIVSLRNGKPHVQAKFPQIGNIIQVIVTFLLLGISMLYMLPYPILWAVGFGQLISFTWFFPKILRFKRTVEQALQQEMMMN